MSSKRRKVAPKGRGKEEKSISLSLETYERFTQKLKEPLFAISLLSLLLVSIRFSAPDWMFDAIPKGLVLLAAAAVYFAKKDKKLKSRWKYIIPLLVTITALFSWYVGLWGYPASRDYLFFAVISGIMLVFSALTIYRLVDWELSVVLSILVSALVLHLVPATSELIGNLDSYWQYKWMQGVYDGHIPEYDDLVYPMSGGLQMHWNKSYVQDKSPLGHGLPQHTTPMLNPVIYAVLALVLMPFDFTLYDIAMLLPGVIGGLVVIPMYLLVKEMFSEMHPHNKIAGILAAFIFMFSPGFAINGTAANCEDDVFGMFIMLSSFYLFFASVNRRSFKYAILAGIGFMMLKLTWAYSYAYLTIGVFGIIYSLILFAHKENATRIVPYLTIAIAIGELSNFFTHEQLALPVYSKMPPIALFPIAGAIGLPIILQAISTRLWGIQKIKINVLEDRIDSLIQKHIFPLAIIILLGGLVVTVLEGGISDISDVIIRTIMGAKIKSIVHQTVSEQNPMAIDLNSFLSNGYSKYGVALFYGLLMLPFLIHLALKKRSIGALFILTWSIPMMWGSYNKSAWIFAASPSITALGATIGLFAASTRKELDDWRIIGTIMLLFIPMLYVPFFGMWKYSNFVGYVVMHMALTPDIFYWQPMLEWAYNKTSPNHAILTWWDYGHWITAVSKRPVLIDNLQADYYEIQDVARFFVNQTSEEEAFEMVSAYNDAYKKTGRELKYVTIDWTMIGKGSALHYIANGDLGSNEPADPMWGWRNFGQCKFMPENSMIKPQITTDGKGGFSQVQKLIFGCTNYVRGVIFTLSDGEIKDIEVAGPYGDLIPWSKWSASTGASLLGVQPLKNIMLCAANYDSPNMDPSSQYVCRFYPMFSTLVYVPDEFNDFMLTRLYLMHDIREYKANGLYNREIKPLKHFRPKEEFSLGFVRVYEISYDGFNDDNVSPVLDGGTSDLPAATTVADTFTTLNIG